MTYLEFLHRVQLAFISGTHQTQFLCTNALREGVVTDHMAYYCRFTTDILEAVPGLKSSFTINETTDELCLYNNETGNTIYSWSPPKSYFKRLEVLNKLIELEESRSQQ